MLEFFCPCSVYSVSSVVKKLLHSKPEQPELIDRLFNGRLNLIPPQRTPRAQRKIICCNFLPFLGVLCVLGGKKLLSPKPEQPELIDRLVNGRLNLIPPQKTPRAQRKIICCNFLPFLGVLCVLGGKQLLSPKPEQPELIDRLFNGQLILISPLITPRAQRKIICCNFLPFLGVLCVLGGKKLLSPKPEQPELIDRLVNGRLNLIPPQKTPRAQRKIICCNFLPFLGVLCVLGG
ncbi:hypothetical protein [Amphritea atlantica]|uniref:hypothetical protein n=1 Tax=Amphritea atlantica TaxID=355243 RepID=UPI0021C403C8|nr:hypothetical protein [Amphritea atlantica]